MWNYQIEENILYEDKEILVCRKTAGMPVQAAKIGTMDMESALKGEYADMVRKHFMKLVKPTDHKSGTKNTGKDPISGSSTSP